MNFAILRKTWRDSMPFLTFGTLALIVFGVLAVSWLRYLSATAIDVLSKSPFIVRMISALVGADLSEDLSPTSLITIALSHPFLFVVSWAFLLVTGSRVIAGEIDRGTGDLLFALPYSRARIYRDVSIVLLIGGIPLLGGLFTGIWTGSQLFPLKEPIQFAKLAPAVANLLALYWSIGGLTMALSASASRRGLVIGVVAGFLLFSFLLNFVEAILPWAGRLAPLGVLHYYKPLESVRSGTWPIGHIAILLGIAVVAWTYGWRRFVTRDIPAA